MSVRRKTENRKILFRDCFICGKHFSTTADTPFVRQMYNVDGKKQKTCYFCSEGCKKKSYKHLFDGKADQRRKERDTRRDIKEKNKRYYLAHSEEIKAKQKKRYQENREEMLLNQRYNREKRKLMAVQTEGERKTMKNCENCGNAGKELCKDCVVGNPPSLWQPKKGE